MGNRTSLSFDDYCEFEANNCLPVTWLALFTPDEFKIEIRQEDPEEGGEYEVVLYRTSHISALNRVEQTIALLKGHTPIWGFLKPLELLRNELERCLSTGSIELDVTQLWAMDESFQQKIANAAQTFFEIIKRITGDKEADLALLNELVKEFSLGYIPSVAKLSPEERMFVLIGTYWGNADQEALYTFDYFNEEFWNGGM
jgi:hypothetical protein